MSTESPQSRAPASTERHAVETRSSPAVTSADPSVADRVEPDSGGGAVDSPPDLDHRRLCSDGCCIGVIGEDGACKACGKPYVPPEDNTPTILTDEANDAVAFDPSWNDDSPPDLSTRLLCRDGNCIGVVGADRRCRECGKHYDRPELDPPDGSESEQPADSADDAEGQKTVAGEGGGEHVA